ncbi:MAG: integrase core domain-containing protein [Acidimicrobiales bacterium]
MDDTSGTHRFVGTARRECLNWLLIRNERHLERVLTEFVEHYNSARPHRGIDLEVPARTIGALAVRCNSRNPATRDVEAVPGAFPADH